MIHFHLDNLYTRVDKKLATKEELEQIHKILSVRVPGYFYSPHFRRGLWDGYRRFFNLLTSTFYTGLIGYVTSKIEFPYEIIDDRILVESKNNILSLNGIELRDYQIKMINEAVSTKRGIISAPPNAGKCLPGSELVSLADGRHLPVKLIKPGDKILSLNSSFEQEEDTVTAIHSNGRKLVFGVKTRNGKELKLTDNHPLLSGLGFNQLRDLNIGSLVGTVREYIEPKAVKISDYKLIFLAYYLSEGGYQASVSFCNTDDFILADFKKAAEFFDNTEVVADSPGGAPGNKIVHNLRIRRIEKLSWNNKKSKGARSGAQVFLDELDLRWKNSYTKEIPEIIFQLSNKQLALFLNRYFCGDGEYGVNENRCYVSVGSASKKMLNQLSQLLLRFGVVGKISKKIVRQKFVSWVWTSIGYDSVYRFIKEIGIASKEDKQAKILRFLKRKGRRFGRANFDILPVTWEELEVELGDLKSFYKCDPIYRRKKLSRYSGKKFIDRSCIVKKLASKFIYWDSIVELTELKEEETFNITTCKNHNFIVNDIYTHNTEVACGIIQVLGLSTNFFTHRITLMKQTKARMEQRLGVKIGMIGAGIREIEDINVLSVPSIAKNLNDPEIREMLSRSKVVISDECHHIQSKTFESCLKACNTSYYRYGLSATALMRDEISNLIVRGLTGDEIVSVTNKDLIEAGISALPTAYLHYVSEPKIPGHYTFDQAYEKGILNNLERNRFIVMTAKRFVEQGKSVFILVWRIAHGEVLLKMVEDIGLEVEFISGGRDNVHEALNKFKKKKLRCLISSTISDEGLDVPAMDVLIMGVGFKAPLKTIQRVGRALRKKSGENVVTIIDFIDAHNKKYLFKHSENRIREYLNMGMEIFEVADESWERITAV